MKAKPVKTNAVRMLEKLKIPHAVRTYEVDEEDLSAAHTAESLGQDAGRVFKTIVLKGDKTGHVVCVVAGDAEIDLKTAAAVSGNKSCKTIAVKELLPLTGYVRGGCSPLGMKKPFPTYFDESMKQYETVFVSAGARGVQLEIAPDDLARAANAVFCSFGRDH